MTFVIYGSMFMAYASGGRSAACRARKFGLRLVAAWTLTTRRNPAADSGHWYFPSTSLPVRGAGAAARCASGGCRCQGGVYGQAFTSFGRPAASIRKIDGTDTQPDRQPSLMGFAPARGTWLSAGRKPVECVWSIAPIVCTQRNSYRPTNCWCPSGPEKFRTAYQKR